MTIHEIARDTGNLLGFLNYLTVYMYVQMATYIESMFTYQYHQDYMWSLYVYHEQERSYSLLINSFLTFYHNMGPFSINCCVPWPNDNL